jgi:hypothetical protein
MLPSALHLDLKFAPLLPPFILLVKYKVVLIFRSHNFLVLLNVHKHYSMVISVRFLTVSLPSPILLYYRSLRLSINVISYLYFIYSQSRFSILA